LATGSPDGVTASAISAREEIGQAVAAKIRETRDVYELKKVAEDVLPEIEKFLESPEEKRLRRMRVAMILSSIGLGAALSCSLLGIFVDKDLLVLSAMGLVTFFIGLGFFLNGTMFSLPRENIADRTSDADSQRQLDVVGGGPTDHQLPQPVDLFSSVTENTTKHLREKQPELRD
jgi:hypothetical protein